MTPLAGPQVRTLRQKVWAHYRAQGRHDLPWRHTTNPYRILVSEVMLQQTQVVRVLPKYRAFLKRFPTVRALAQAPLGDVLIIWQGLGYNRRAKALHRAAGEIVARHAGRIPQSFQDLCVLPGIGPYTAAAVCTFAFGEARPLLETNIRTVLLYHLVPNRTSVPDSELHTLAGVLMDTRKPREWHWALMDYGAHLKAKGVRQNARSRHYKKQSPFAGSDREVRGAIVRHLSTHRRISVRMLERSLSFPHTRTRRILDALVGEGMVVRDKRMLSLPR